MYKFVKDRAEIREPRECRKQTTQDPGLEVEG